MTSSRILIVDDDVSLCEMVVAFLREDGFDASAVHSGEAAMERVAEDTFDAIVLDVMMPGMSGHEVLRRLQSNSAGIAPMPVLMLTARGDDVDRIVGLETGADDYLAKPCNLRELAARLRAVLRRSGRNRDTRADQALAVADIKLDPGTRVASRAGEPLKLTGAEFAVLRELMQNAGQPVSKESLTRAALGREYIPYDRSIDVHVANLRKKLGQSDGAQSLISTIRGTGYQFISTPGG